MFGSQILEVAIGVIFVYLLVSIICTAVREGLEGWLKSRAAYLEHGIRELLHDKGGAGLAAALYKHPLVFSLYSGEYTPGTSKDSVPILAQGTNLPSYIPSKNFALALMDIAVRGPRTETASSDASSPLISLESLRANIRNLENPAVQRVLLTAIDAAQGDLNKAQAHLEAWFDTGMDRVSGWYKRSTQWILFCIGLAIAVLLNVNSIVIAQYLYHNDTARAALVATAQSAATDTAFVSKRADAARTALEGLDLPIGWKGWEWANPCKQGWLATVVTPGFGFLLTAFAATLGAPFWFDVLNKVMVIRSTVKPHEKSQEEASQDHQRKSEPPSAAAAPVSPSPDGATPKSPPTPPPTPPTPQAPINNARAGDAESDVDACDALGAPDATVTTDDKLPEAQGGVQ